MPLNAGDLLGPYRILEPIGRGGMGEVYRAHDAKLDRDVAIKVLRDYSSKNPESLKRFQREVRAVAALSHPNILAIHDFGEAGGVVYAVMELLEGETLRSRLNEGPLSRRKAIDYALQIAQGLAAAHDKGIVHRDLKPENVFVTRDGRVKILDFGLAKVRASSVASQELSESPTLTQGTSAGALLGTIGYMSPDQLRGRTADSRSDLFSLGVVLFEMLTGKRAFQRDAAVETMSAILTEDPLERLGSGDALPLGLERVVRRALEKSPSERFQTARDFAFALDTHSELSAPAPVHRAPGEAPASIAVLPFTNMSSDPEQEYFCEGMAEEIINALAKIQTLRVASRTSAFRFKDKARDIREIGRALNVKTLLEGSVRSAGRRLRVTAQLVNVDDGYHLWSERYDRERDDIFAIQEEIATSIVGALRSELVGPAHARGGKRHTNDLEAYRLYLKGQHNWYKRYKDSIQKAAHFFEKAVERDPSYALAHAGVADAYNSLGVYGLEPGLASSKARAAAERALAIDQSLAEAHASMAYVHFCLDWDWMASEREFHRALQFNPSYVLAYCWHSFLLLCLGRGEEAVRATRRAQELDALSPYANSLAGASMLATGQLEAALGEFQKALGMDEDSLLTLYLLGGAYSIASMHDRAVRTLEKAATLAGRASFYLGWLGWAYGRAGGRDEARRVLQELQERARKEYVSPLFFSWVYAGMDRTEAALDMLEKGYEERSPLMPFWWLSVFDSLRHHPRLRDVLRRMSLSPFPESAPA